MKSKSPLILHYVDINEDVVFAEFSDILNVNEIMAQQIIDSRLEFTNGRKHFVVIDMSKVRQVTSKAKEILQSPDRGTKNILGAAFIASNPVSELIANIFIKKPKDFEARFFSNKKDAISWIYELKKIFGKKSSYQLNRKE